MLRPTVLMVRGLGAALFALPPHSLAFNYSLARTELLRQRSETQRKGRDHFRAARRSHILASPARFLSLHKCSRRLRIINILIGICN